MAYNMKRPSAGFRASSQMDVEVALAVLFLLAGVVNGASHNGEMLLANVTRFATGDLFSLIGSDCGPTRCMELSHGTALAAMSNSDSCMCQCRHDTPAFREDQKICVNHIEECPMASFGRGAKMPQIPFAFLPLKGQIIYPSKEIVFTDVEDAICAVTSAQYLSHSGWVTLRDLLDNDVPFSLYRDEGSTFLQWRGSTALHARLEGRLVAAHVLCSAPAPTRLAASCAAFRVAGVSHHPLFDVPSIPFHSGEIVTSEPSQNQGLSVLESLAIGVCVLMLIFVYAAGIIFYIHYKKRQKRKNKDPESNTLSTDNGSTLGSRIDLNNVMLKTNPLLKMDSLGVNFLHDAGLSDVSERTEETVDSSPADSQSHKFQKLNSSVISAMVHTRRMKKPSRPSIKPVTERLTPERFINERIQRRSASPEIERAPHSDLAIVDCIENSMTDRATPIPNGEPAMRRKLYFNPVFFETEHLKDPPPAAIEFLIKIREVMFIAKDKMTSKRFIPSLSDIPEEESYHSIDLGWDIPCARRGRRFSAISLKRENSRRSAHCGGCPGCDNREPVQKPALVRSNSCKSCVSDDYKQRIVRKWLDEVPSPAPRNDIATSAKSVAKVSGTPRVIQPKMNDSKTTPRLSSPEPLKSTKFAEFDPKQQIKSLRVKELPMKKEILAENSTKKEETKEVPVHKDKLKEVQGKIKTPVVKEALLKIKAIAKKEILIKKEAANGLEMNKDLIKEVTAKIDIIKETPIKKEMIKTTTINNITDKESAESPPELSVKIIKDIPQKNIGKDISEKKEIVKEVVASKKESPKETSIKRDLVKEFTAKKDFVKEMFMKKDQSKETVPKRDFRTEKPKIIHNVPLDKESGVIEETVAPQIIDALPIINIGKTDNSSNRSETQSPTLSASSGKNPSNHLSQRIRMKLPPPPPPPVILPKPIVPPKPELESESSKENEAPIPPEVKVKMEAVIKELNKCKREETYVEEEIKTENVELIPPKLVIPVLAADTHYFSDDNTLNDYHRKYIQREPFVDLNSLERNMLKKRRFSLASGPELAYRIEHVYKPDLQGLRETLTRSWRDVRKAVDNYQFVPPREKPVPSSRSRAISQVIVDTEPLYDNLAKPGPLTIKVRGSPEEVRRKVPDEFEPDTLDRKPGREAKKRVEKILLKSGGSFKHKGTIHECGLVNNVPEPLFTRKIGSLRQIYEAKAKSQEEQIRFPYYGRRGSVPYGGHELASLVRSVKASDLIRQIEAQKDGMKPPVPPKLRRGSDLSPKFMHRSPIGEKRATRSPEERERYQMYLRGENLKRSGRRSNRTRSRRTDIRKLYRTEDSGYLSTDSNESKRRASYLMQLRPKLFPEQTAMPPMPTIVRTPILQHIESDTDDLESICDGRSESGGESIETDSVFFGNFDEPKQMLAELGLSAYDIHRKMRHHEQIDSGFMGETNIILSGDSDSEHRSVISIVTSRDGRTSSASITQLDDTPYMHSVEC